MESFREELLKWLPENYECLILSVTPEKSGFSALIRINISSKSAALEWVQQFCENSFVTFKTARTFPDNTQKLIFKKEYRCLHNTRSSQNVKTPHRKHTGCNA
ncbi:hypothetical protein ABEB36_000014 [Hypothenemus hampei]|uniref:LAGLIDADG homing endonuclease n=1 Tax=Hypothenemus hampei TaxID=57062 RepID=A0ABD1F9Y9_HYPHA